MSLNKRQLKFCECYLEYGDLQKALEKAEYSKKYANSLMKNVDVINYIKNNNQNNAKVQNISCDLVANSTEILEYLTKIMRGEEKDDKSSIKEKIRAAELLGKAFSIFSNDKKNHNEHHINIAGEDEILE